MSSLDASQIKVTGEGLTEGTTGKKCEIYFTGAPIGELEKGLTTRVDGPQKSEIIVDFEKENSDGQVEAYYVPIVPGDYKITVRFNGRQVPGSPFKPKVTGQPVSAEKLISKATIHGRASELGKAYSVNEFVVDCSRVKPVIGSLKVHVKGQERSSAQLNLVDNKNGTFRVLYKPTSPGMYEMDIKIADAHIPGSPLKIRVTEFLSC
ncbi:filamin-B-like [Oppia nitens]|uniref:filamin-B-like n=1 Tax=Oppia nitens TaxID=1686743 RepID=UPI0023DAC098|nr:filamin-B-like [Oppia nitens]